jgi:hypothetical protein
VSPFYETPSLSLRLLDSEKEHAEFESLARNRISNVSFAVSSAGEILILVVMVGIVKALHAGDSAENNTRTFSVLCAFSGGVWSTSPFVCRRCGRRS